MDVRTKIPTETDALLANEHALIVAPPQPKKSWVATAASVTLGTIGIGAGALYFGPAQSCAVTVECGKYLSDVLSKNGAIVVFTAGGADFSAGAMFMGAQSAEATVHYIQRQKTLGAKIGKGLVVLTFATSQTIPLFLASLSTSTELWQTLLTVGGSAPAALFGAINMTETEIPFWMSRVRVGLSKLSHRILDNCVSHSPAEQQQWRQLTHYRQQHTAFLGQLDARWDYLVAHARAMHVDGQDEPLTQLFAGAAPPAQSSWLASGMHQVGVLSGFLLGATHSYGGIANTFKILSHYLPSLPLQILATSLLSTSGLYANLKLTIDGVTGLLDTMIDVVRGKPINSIAFQLRPKTTVLIAGLSMAASVLSYAVIATLLINDLKDGKEPGYEFDAKRKTFLYGAMAGIDIYHLASLMHLYRLFFTALTRDQKEKFIFQIEKEVHRLQKMTEKEFIEFVTTNSADKNALLGLQVFDSDQQPDLELGGAHAHVNGEEMVVVVSDRAANEAPKTSWSIGNWCNWFSATGPTAAAVARVEREYDLARPPR